MKYSDDSIARSLSSAPDYNAINMAAIKEMKRQVGDLVLADDGMAVTGLIIRHLVLPNRQSGTKEILSWISANLGQGTHVSLMSQYFPAYKAIGDVAIGKKITRKEYDEALSSLEQAGLENGWVQDFEEGQGLE